MQKFKRDKLIYRVDHVQRSIKLGDANYCFTTTTICPQDSAAISQCNWPMITNQTSMGKIVQNFLYNLKHEINIFGTFIKLIRTKCLKKTFPKSLPCAIIRDPGVVAIDRHYLNAPPRKNHLYLLSMGMASISPVGMWFAWNRLFQVWSCEIGYGTLHTISTFRITKITFQAIY